MELARVEIERYGLLENYTLNSLAPGLNLIVGENEAGKTTLLSFIRNVLFGFPSRKQVNDYRLNPEDKLGGRLLVKSRDYPEGLTIERRSGKGGGPVGLYLKDGTRVAEEALGRLLGNLDRTLYRNIFAFGLSELANLETLNSDDLQARIYSAGTGTGAGGVPETLKRLDKELEDIFKPGGRKPQINTVLNRINELEKELGELGAYAGRYTELVGRRTELEKESESLVERGRENTSLLDEKQRLFSGRETWNQYCEAQTHLNELEALPEDFPVRAGERLGELNRSIQEVRRELEELDHRLGEEKAGFVSDKELENLFRLREKITPVARGLGQYEKALDDLPRRRAEMESVLESLNKKIAEINRSWTKEDLLAFDSSIAARDRLRTMKQDIEQARLKLIETGQSVRHAEEEFTRAEQTCFQAENAFKAKYARRISLLRSLTLPIPLIALAVSIWLLFTGQSAAGGVLGALALALLSGWLWVRRALEKQISAPGRQHRLLNFWLEERGELERLAEEKAGRGKKFNSEQGENKQASDALTSRQEEFSRFLRELGLEESLSPEALGDVINQVNLAREENNKAEQLEKRITEIDGFIEEYRGEVCALLEELGSQEPERKETAGAVGRLLQDLERAREYHTVREKHEQNLKWLAEQAERQKEKLAGLLEEKEKLTDVSAVESDDSAEAGEERFLQHAAVAAERDIWQGRRKEVLSNLAIHAGSPEKLEEYLAELAKVSFERLEGEIKALQEERLEAEQEKKRVNQQLGENKKELAQVSTETEAGRLRLERSVAVEELAEFAERWAVLTLAAQAVRRAMERYERERQPEVLRHAETYFTKMTVERYRKIIKPVGEQRFEVCTVQGGRLPPEKLSRGTAEQLYFALRLGLIEERKKHSEPVPIMMDDILVNFDPKRAKAACRAIARIAESHQVIYLTCHPHIVELLRKQLPKINMLRLEVL